ncbi:MAG: hypothetical protein ABI402_20390 [Ferruginibacter sp.]
MSDHSISIVPKQSVYPNKEIKSKEILQWLVSLDIVKPTLSDCILSSKNGYSISEGAKLVVAEAEYLPFLLITNGLEIITERQIFHTGQNGMDEVICPACNENIAGEDWDFLSEWDDNKSNNLTCPLCNAGTDIYQFNFTPEWGFSNLGFTFWNWSGFTDNFLNDFKQKLGCDINIVPTWI